MRTLTLASRALRAWGPRAWLVAAASALATGVLIGLATVLIPNPVFRRDIAPVWWNYPALVVIAALSGLLLATYVRPAGAEPAAPQAEASEQRRSLLGMGGAVLGWFAVGCPVCNKIALLALGYTGALTYFGPLQPVLGALSLALLGYALVRRLAGQQACAVPPRRAAEPVASR